MAVTDGAIGEDALVELIPAFDPYLCDDCLASGDACRFHAGYAEGWDEALALFHRMVEGARHADLLGDVEDFDELGIW